MKINKIKLNNIGVHTNAEFDISAREVFSGPSGIGKTTILKSIMSVFSDSKSDICRNIITNGKETGVVELFIENENKLFEIKRTLGVGSSIICNGNKCKDVKSLMELCGISKHELYGIFLDDFFTKLTSKEKLNALLKNSGITFPELKGFEGSENPIEDCQKQIKFLDGKINSTEEKIKSSEETLKIKLKEFSEKKEDESKEEMTKRVKSLEKEVEELKKERQLHSKKVSDAVASLEKAKNGKISTKKEIEEMELNLKSLNAGKCRLCGSSTCDEDKKKELELKIENSKKILKKCDPVIKQRGEIKKDLESQTESFSKNDNEKNSELAALKEKLKKFDDSNIVKVLEESLDKERKSLDSLKTEKDKLVTELKNFAEIVMPGFEKKVNDNFKSVYFGKGVFVKVFDEETKKTCFEISYNGENFKQLSGEEELFAKADISLNLGSKVLLLDKFEASCNIDTLEEISESGIQIIAAEKMDIEMIKKSWKKRTFLK